MNTKWIGILSLAGVIMGFLTSLFGLSPTVEPVIWIGFYVVWGVVVVKLKLPAFTTPLLASLLSGLWTGLIQFFLWKSYVTNNPWYAEELSLSEAPTISVVLGFAMIMGLFWGLVVGASCYGVVTTIDRLAARRRANTTTPE